jgi:hypothetical protein
VERLACGCTVRLKHRRERGLDGGQSTLRRHCRTKLRCEGIGLWLEAVAERLTERGRGLVKLLSEQLRPRGECLVDLARTRVAPVERDVVVGAEHLPRNDAEEDCAGRAENELLDVLLDVRDALVLHAWGPD